MVEVDCRGSAGGQYERESSGEDRPRFCAKTYPDDFLKGHMSPEAVEQEDAFCPKLDRKLH